MVFINFQSHLYFPTDTPVLLCYSCHAKTSSLEFSSDNPVCNADILVGRRRLTAPSKKKAQLASLLKNKNINAKCEETRREKKKGEKE